MEVERGVGPRNKLTTTTGTSTQVYSYNNNGSKSSRFEIHRSIVLVENGTKLRENSTEIGLVHALLKKLNKYKKERHRCTTYFLRGETPNSSGKSTTKIRKYHTFTKTNLF